MVYENVQTNEQGTE